MIEAQIHRELERLEGEQWGKPGPGGAYWRPSAITGQGFFDKMVSGDGHDDDGEQWTECFLFQGWCGSADPRKRGTGTKNAEVENLHLR